MILKEANLKEEFTELAGKLLEIQKKVKFLKEKEKEMALLLKERCDYRSTKFNGYAYKVSERPGSVRYTDIPELKGLNLDVYRNDPVSIWRLTFQEQFDI